MSRWLYWTIHPRTGRIAVRRETLQTVYGDGPSGPTHRPRRECRGRYASAQSCIDAWEMLLATRREYRLRREAISLDKQKLRRQELMSLVQITGGPP